MPLETMLVLHGSQQPLSPVAICCRYSLYFLFFLGLTLPSHSPRSNSRSHRTATESPLVFLPFPSHCKQTGGDGKGVCCDRRSIGAWHSLQLTQACVLSPSAYGEASVHEKVTCPAPAALREIRAALIESNPA